MRKRASSARRRKEKKEKKVGLRCGRRKENAVEGNMRALRVFCSSRAISSACTKGYPRVSRGTAMIPSSSVRTNLEFLNFRPLRHIA